MRQMGGLKQVKPQGPRADDAETLQRGLEAGKLLMHAERSMLSRTTAIRQRIFAVLDSKTALDPDAAVQAWIEMHEAEKLVAFLGREVKEGQQAGERMKPQMERKPLENAQ